MEKRDIKKRIDIPLKGCKIIYHRYSWKYLLPMANFYPKRRLYYEVKGHRTYKRTVNSKGK